MTNKFIVAIGFSEGGLAPLLTLFNSTPHDQATYIILRHLPANSCSQLQHILKQHSKLNIIEVVDEMVIEKDSVYMPPPSKYVTIKHDKLFLHSRLDQPSAYNQIVDIFLTSMAKSKGDLSIAIILSGNGDDGSKGAALLKEAGGMVIVQNLDSSEVKAMPLNALKTGAVDFELMASEMPGVVLHHIATTLKSKNMVENAKEAGEV
jgi:chemotaxis response regulator CheB